MTDFGGLGGGRTERNYDDEFENALERALGEQMRKDDALCQEVWSALANVDWKHTNGDTASYSFRAGGDVIASIIGRGDYMRWYCRSPYAQVSDRVSDAMAKEGWTWEVMPCW